jgi:hypothetical protein
MPGCSSPSRPSPSADAGSPVAPCLACRVSAAPKPLVICVISGHGAPYDKSTATLTANGSPPGGTFSWRSKNGSIATVAGAGATGTVTGVAKGRVEIEVTYTVAGCGPCKDTVPVRVCVCSRVNKYAYYNVSVADLNGAKGKIKTRFGKLCCEAEGCSVAHALHCTYVNISNTSGDLKWAQSGYGRERNYGSAAIATDRYAEVQGDTYHIRKEPAPAEGSVHEYKIELDPATGKWSFYFDGARWHNVADPFWRGKRGDSVQWTGEIHNTDDDMSGTAGDKCAFTELQYRVRGPLVYRDAGVTIGAPTSESAAEWGAEHVSATALNIWDKNPN